MSARRKSTANANRLSGAKLKTGQGVASDAAEEDDEKPVLRREEFICSTAHNAHLDEDFLEDKSCLFGRPLPTTSRSRSQSRSETRTTGSLKHVSSERLLRKFFRSADTRSLRSVDDGAVPPGKFSTTVGEEQSRSGVLGSQAPGSDAQPKKPPRRMWRRSKKTRSSERNVIDEGKVDTALHNGTCHSTADTMIAPNPLPSSENTEGTSLQYEDKHPPTNDRLEARALPTEEEETPRYPRRSSRLVRRNSTRRPLACDSADESTSKLYKRDSLTHPRLPVEDTEEDNSRTHSTSSGSTPQRPRRIKRESLIHPPQSLGSQNMSQDTNQLSQPGYENGRFKNPWNTWMKPTAWAIAKWKLGSRNNTALPSSEKELDKTLPIQPLKTEEIQTPPSDGIRVTWMGHSTTLVQFDGISVLTDPMMSERASPISILGPKRFRNFPGSVHDLPKVDAVVISHNHYDHLDYNSVVQLNARFGTDLHWFVPSGLALWMRQAGCQNVTELSWWQKTSLPQRSDTTFVFTPAQHWSKRTVTDDDKSLWGSWCILGFRHSFYFAGDTGYCSCFKEIGEQYGPFDLAAIPIGAYEPRYVMKAQHVDPEEAVKIHKDIQARRSIGIHWGTFALAHEYYLEPPKKLYEAMRNAYLDKNEFFVLKHGESRLLIDNS